MPWFDVADQVVTEARDFLTGFREAPEPEKALATVLFTDIVGSTERARELGDQEWSSFSRGVDLPSAVAGQDLAHGGVVALQQ